MVKNPCVNAGGGEVRDAAGSLGQEDPLEEGMATHSSILAWTVPRTEEPGGLWSIGSQRSGHDCSDLARTRARTHAPTHTAQHQLMGFI